ncbi:MAG: PilZ domain-containing protein [Phycisphaeraceae bacterium]|nr:PilZ domain-containing protein [Phycisphaeraceae bacterium]
MLPTNESLTPRDIRDAQRRRHGRVYCQGILCTLGDILDLSASGMRVGCFQKPPPAGEIFDIVLHSCEGEIAISCGVVWVSRKGFFRYEAGLAFGELTPAIRQTLSRLARTVAQNETILPSLRQYRRAG